MEMHILESRDLTAGEAYALLVGAVVPRPIAWITSIDLNGSVNAAPFSCYTFVCNRPPMLGVNIGRRDGTLKDTAHNVHELGEFVVNVVPEDLAAPMHHSSAEYPAGASEPALLGIELAPSRRVKPPRIAPSPISMECRLHRIVELGEDRSEFIIGEIMVFHVADEVHANGRIDIRKFHPLARLGGPHYARLGEIITMPVVGNPEPIGAKRGGI